MNLTQNETEFIKTAAASLGGQKFEPDHELFPWMFITANQQKLLPYIFEYVRLLPGVPDEKNAELFSIMKQQVISQVVNQTVHTAEFSALYRRLREMGLHPVVVKGQLCSRLYPMKDHRISADDDIYVSDDEFLKCHNALTEYGLKTECAEEDLLHEDEVTYKDTERMLYVEMHRRLFDSSEDAHDELNGFFSDIHSRCVETDGFYSMPPHEHLLYLILHAYKHFVSCGVGLRQFFDIGFWAREYEREIDFDKLYRQCESVHAATFASVIFSVCRERLGISFEPGEMWKCDVQCEPMLHDVLCGGIYGSNDYTRLHSSTVTLSAVKSSRKGKNGSVLSTLFPKKTYMEKKYPYVKKNPILLPTAWIARIADYIKETKNTQNDNASDSLKLAKERIELMKMYNIM